MTLPWRPHPHGPAKASCQLSGTASGPVPPSLLPDKVLVTEKAGMPRSRTCFPQASEQSAAPALPTALTHSSRLAGERGCLRLTAPVHQPCLTFTRNLPQQVFPATCMWLAWNTQQPNSRTQMPPQQLIPMELRT